MLNSVKIDSYPITVRFAGWESDTFRLQRSGWQIAAYDIFNMRGSNDVQLILRHDGLKLHAITNVIQVMPYYLDASKFAADRALIDYYRSVGFDVKAMGSEVVIHYHNSSSSDYFNYKDFSSNFSAVNCEPSVLHDYQLNLNTIKVFRPISSTAPEIIIPTYNVDEMMNMVLKLQDPVQAEIRERRRKEKMRGEWRESGYDAQADIKCQILAFG